MKKHFYMNVYVLAVIMGVGLISQPCTAHADFPVSRLTTDNVTAFINKTTDIALGRGVRMSETQMREYLDTHIEDDARFVSEMSYAIPGFPTQSNKMAVDKPTYIESLINSADTLENYDAEVVINDIQISKDGSKATVYTTSSESGNMGVPEDESGEMSALMPLNGSSTCTQILSLNKKDKTIQMYHAKCTTTVAFEDIF